MLGGAGVLGPLGPFTCSSPKIIEDMLGMAATPVIPALWRGGSRIRSSRLTYRKTLPQKTKSSQVLVAHAYNPSYSGGKDQEDCGSIPV
jgi:hypothetical protein